MPSVIPGFEYDIFISYRHNDNRSGWVTDFVNALQEELAATIKEPLSIYFDKNPHDGLLETHNVDKSLEGKLKCLIFIPIVSQTYCDPKSFAWQHEFCAFNKLAKEDQFGRDIKLSNGNVTSRILPIKIHDLDYEDKATIEKEIGGALRAIEVIYKEPGVNRPLKISDDRSINQNKTDYRNQTNKLANAVKEIVTAIKLPVDGPPVPQSTYRKPQAKYLVGKLAIAGLVTILTLGLSYWYIITNDDIPEPNKKSIAVLAFKNLGPPEKEYLSDGIAEELISKLTMVNGLVVTPRVSSFQFKTKEATLLDISKELNAKYILDGSVSINKDSLKISVTLIEASNGRNQWAQIYSVLADNIFKAQSDIVLDVVKALETELNLETKNAITELPTQSKEAYDLYLKANNIREGGKRRDLQIALQYYTKAFELDPNFTDARRAIAEIYLIDVGREGYSKNWLDSALNIVTKLIEIEPDNFSNYLIKAWALSEKGSFPGAFDAYKLAAQTAPNADEFRFVNAALGSLHQNVGNLALSFELKLPRWRYSKDIWSALQMARLMAELDETALAKKFAEHAIAAEPGNVAAQLFYIELTALTSGTKKATILLDSLKLLYKESIDIQMYLGLGELMKKNYRQAEGHYLKFIEAYPDFDPGFLPYRTHLGKIYSELAKEETNQFKGASTNARKYLYESFRMDSLARAMGDQASRIPYNFALINFVKGNKAEGYRWLQKTIDEGFLNYRLLLIEPILEKYKEEDEFIQIVNRMKDRIAAEKKTIEAKFGMDINKIAGLTEETFLKRIYWGMGVSYMFRGERVFIAKVMDNSPAEESGLKKGDEVLSFSKGDKADFIEASPKAYSEMTKYIQEEGAVVRLKIKREGKSSAIIFVIKSMLIE